MPNSAILLIHCPDRKGIVAGVSGFLHRHGANILHADQHQDNDLGLFFMRVEWDLTDFALDDAAFRAEFRPLAESFQMQWQLAYSAARAAVAVFVSQQQHCLVDLLFRHRIGELRCETWSGWCFRPPCAGIWITASCNTPARPWCSIRTYMPVTRVISLNQMVGRPPWCWMAM